MHRCPTDRETVVKEGNKESKDGRTQFCLKVRKKERKKEGKAQFCKIVRKKEKERIFDENVQSKKTVEIIILKYFTVSFFKDMQ